MGIFFKSNFSLKLFEAEEELNFLIKICRQEKLSFQF